MQGDSVFFSRPLFPSSPFSPFSPIYVLSPFFPPSLRPFLFSSFLSLPPPPYSIYSPRLSSLLPLIFSFLRRFPHPPKKVVHHDRVVKHSDLTHLVAEWISLTRPTLIFGSDANIFKPLKRFLSIFGAFSKQFK